MKKPKQAKTNTQTNEPKKKYKTHIQKQIHPYLHAEKSHKNTKPETMINKQKAYKHKK